MASSVGLTARASCAAIRAGVSRERPIQYHSVLDVENHEPVPLTGHPVGYLTEGFGPSARWLLMAERAIEDLVDDVDDLPDGRYGLVVVLPVLDDARFFFAPGCTPEAVWQALGALVHKRLGVQPVDQGSALVHIGAAGIGLGLHAAREGIRTGAVDRVLVLAIDSLLDAHSLNWLSAMERLKTPDNPVGLAPGEAAVALLCEPQGGPGSLGHLNHLSFVDGDNPFLNTERRQGREMAAALESGLAAGAARGEMYVDLNGETWRSAELGSALATEAGSNMPSDQIVFPATSVGDVGAAAGALHIACALHSFERGYASTGTAWIVSSSEYGEVSVLRLESN